MKKLAAIGLMMGVAMLGNAGDNERFVKSEFHMHTTRSDGNATPLQAAQIYNSKGFNVCIFTDHIADWCYGGWFNPADMFDDAELNDFMSLPGSELSIVQHNRFDRPIEVHINALGIEFPLMPAYTGTIVDEIRTNVRNIWDLGAVPHVNHPNFLWSFDYRELLQIDDPYIFEIVNQDPSCNNYGDLSRPSVEQIWDILLSAGKRVYGSCTDDAHYYYNYTPAASAPGYGWTVCKVSDLNRENLLESLRLGKFYASTGPELESYEVDGRTIKVKVKPQDKQSYRIKFIGRNGRILHEVEGLEAEYTIKGDEYYVRVRIGDNAQDEPSRFVTPGQIALCQPVWVEDIVARENFAPQLEEYAKQAEDAVLAVKFGGEAENFTTVNADTAFDGENIGWRSSGMLKNGETALNGLHDLQCGFVGAELPGTLLFNLPEGNYKATLLTGESGSRIYEPSTLLVTLNGRTVLSGVPVKSGDYRLNTFKFSTDGGVQQLTFRGVPRYDSDFCRNLWSATALIIEKDNSPEIFCPPFFTAEPTIECAYATLELGVPNRITLHSFFPCWSEAELKPELMIPERYQPYFEVKEVKKEQTSNRDGRTLTAEYDVTLIKPFTLQKKMNSTLVGDEYVPEIPEAILFASVTSMDNGSRQSARFRLPLREPKLKVRALNNDNDFELTIIPASAKSCTAKFNLELPENWRLKSALPEEIELKNGEAESVKFTLVPEDAVDLGDYTAILNAEVSGCKLEPEAVTLRRNGFIGTFEGAGEHAVPGAITRGITIVADITVPEENPAQTLVMFREQKYSEVMLYLTDTAQLKAKIEDSIDNYHDRVEAFGPQLEPGRSYHVAFTYDKYLGGALYIDGEKVADNFGDFNVVDIMNNNAPLKLSPAVKKVTLYNHMLSADEIAELK